MSKKIVKVIKLQIPAGKANPAPPIGPALGAAGVNIMKFCQEFNGKTQELAGDILPVEITVYVDKSFTFITKSPPVPDQIKKAIGVEKGSKMPNRDSVGVLTKAQAEEIAKKKMKDMRVTSLSSATQMVLGTARSMGVRIEE